MSRNKLKICLSMFFMILFVGVILVNSAYVRSLGETVKKSVFSEIQTEKNMPELYEDALYSQINILNNEDKDLYLYVHFNPFDLRVSNGDNTLYINRCIIDNLKTMAEKI